MDTACTEYVIIDVSGGIQIHTWPAFTHVLSWRANEAKYSDNVSLITHQKWIPAHWLTNSTGSINFFSIFVTWILDRLENWRFSHGPSPSIQSHEFRDTCQSLLANWKWRGFQDSDVKTSHFNPLLLLIEQNQGNVIEMKSSSVRSYCKKNVYNSNPLSTIVCICLNWHYNLNWNLAQWGWWVTATPSHSMVQAWTVEMEIWKLVIKFSLLKNLLCEKFHLIRFFQNQT